MAIQRIVRMSFHAEKAAEFEMIFWSSKPKILARKGCKGVDLLKDVREPNVYFTLSLWENEESLDSYRRSDLFGSVWPKTKKLFNELPKAWSLVTVAEDH